MTRALLFILLFSLLPARYEPGSYREEGKASYYADRFHGAVTANGERFNMHDFTAAHKSLPFHTFLKVTRRSSGKSILVRVNDRGPYIKGRILDLSKAAARHIGHLDKGLFDIVAEEISFESLDPVTDSLYRHEPVMDGLGNIASLSGRSMRLWSTRHLMHAIYMANDIWLKDTLDQVLVCGRGQGKRRRYDVVITGITGRNTFSRLARSLYRMGFYEVIPYTRH